MRQRRSDEDRMGQKTQIEGTERRNCSENELQCSVKKRRRGRGIEVFVGRETMRIQMIVRQIDRQRQIENRSMLDRD